MFNGLLEHNRITFLLWKKNNKTLYTSINYKMPSRPTIKEKSPLPFPIIIQRFQYFFAVSPRLVELFANCSALSADLLPFKLFFSTSNCQIAFVLCEFVISEMSKPVSLTLFQRETKAWLCRPKEQVLWNFINYIKTTREIAWRVKQKDLDEITYRINHVCDAWNVTEISGVALEETVLMG